MRIGTRTYAAGKGPATPRRVWLGLWLFFTFISGNAQAVTVPHTDKIGAYSQGGWYLDINNNGTWEPGSDSTGSFGTTGMAPVVGDWNGDGYTEVGDYVGGTWYLDLNGNGLWDGEPTDRMVNNFGFADDLPVAGDWNGDGIAEIGVYHPSNNVWYLDYNGNFTYDWGVDIAGAFGFAGCTPVVGDWNGNGLSKIGVYSNGQWYLDNNGNFSWDGSPTDTTVPDFGFTAMLPVVGDWSNSGVDRIGGYFNGAWYLDINGNSVWDPAIDHYLGTFGGVGMLPAVGNWHPAAAPNTPPVANAGPDQNVTTGALVNLNGSSSVDGDGDPLTYSWSFSSRPATSNATLSGATTVAPTFTPDAVGSYLVSLVVNDGTVDSAADSVTISVSPPPPTIDVEVTPAALLFGTGENSARISWSANNAEHVYLRQLNGSQAEVEVFGSYYDTAPLTATTTYVLRVVNSGGASPDAYVTVRVIDPAAFGVAITSPLASDVIEKPFATVEGFVANGGAEVGVTVNGIPAQVVGNRFFVNDLSLTEGDNTLTAVASDTNGNSVQDSLTVTINSTSKEWLEVSLNPESGIADPAASPAKPFTATLKVSPRLLNPLTNWSWGYQYVYTGNGVNPNQLTVVNSSGDGLELQLSFADPGVYRLTYLLQDTGTANGKTYTQDILVNVLDKGEFDSALRQQWEGMKAALAAKNIEGAVAYFREPARDNYRSQFTLLYNNLPQLVAAMQDIELIYLENNRAKHRINRNQIIDGISETVTYYIYFVLDDNGLWKIEQF